MIATNDRPGVEEQYESACHTSDMRVRAEQRGSADIFIAAGWSPSRLGGALMRLHSEWSVPARKGLKPTPAQLQEAGLRLKSRAAVWEGLLPWLLKHGISTQAAEQALLHWAFPTCQRCDGHGVMKALNAPVLTARRCNACHGTGERSVDGSVKAVLVYLDECVASARRSLKKRLRP